MNQRDIDEWHVTAQEYAEKIKNEFMQSLMGNRMNRQNPAAGALPGAQQQPPPMQPPAWAGPADRQPQPQQPPMTGGQYG